MSNQSYDYDPFRDQKKNSNNYEKMNYEQNQTHAFPNENGLFFNIE